MTFLSQQILYEFDLTTKCLAFVIITELNKS